MLFERFVFVLYILFCYNWFLLGYIYNVWAASAITIAMMMTLATIGVVTTFQLQTIIREDAFKPHEKWATVTWTSVHIILSGLIISDSWEIANILVIGLMIGVLLSAVIIVVGTCACYVIMLNGKEWYAHVHMTCISFWVMAQFWSIRLPSDELKYLGTAPIIMMAVLRIVEKYDGTCGIRSCGEMTVWIICAGLHLICDQGGLQKETFLWGTCGTVTILILLNKHVKAIAFMFALPFVTLALGIYVLVDRKNGQSFEILLGNARRAYDEYTKEPELLPFDINAEEEDFDARL